MDVSLRVTIQGKDYGLRVKSGAEAETTALVRSLDERITAFRKAFPMQPELTAVVMTALGLAEEVRQAKALAREAQAQLTDVDGHVAAVEARYTDALVDLDDRLFDALYGADDREDAPAHDASEAHDAPADDASAHDASEAEAGADVQRVD